MYNNDENTSNYEGLFAREPNRSEDTIWGSRETHEQPLSRNVEVTRDWYGNVTDVQRSWY